MKINREENNKIIVGDDKGGFILSQTVEANLLYALLLKLEEIRCGIVDVGKEKGDESDKAEDSHNT